MLSHTKWDHKTSYFPLIDRAYEIKAGFTIHIFGRDSNGGREGSRKNKKATKSKFIHKAFCSLLQSKLRATLRNLYIFEWFAGLLVFPGLPVSAK